MREKNERPDQKKTKKKKKKTGPQSTAAAFAY